ncbi:MULTISPECIES: aspartate aminotransferase family protein [unclassified Nonomuraea]|uniref:aminotransferase family protein n=1 Tax=unclassified Nonomuraea TaxID=2593643 RepID=UPI0033FC1E1A
MTSTSLWHPQTAMSTIEETRTVIASGQGAWVRTEDGQDLLDLPAGLWHANVGHGRARIADAVREQLTDLETYHLFQGMANRPAIRLAERLAALSPIPDAKVFLTSGGSDSVDTACKLARRHWQVAGRPGKRIIVSREHAYHGLHGFGTSITGIQSNRDGYGSDSLIPETARVPWDDLAATEAELLRLGPDNIAALIAEPIIGTGGVLLPAPGYLTGLAELCRRLDILLIADEVITGFGRVGQWFACQRFGIEPDLLTMAKGITSGYLPLGGVLVARRVWEPFFAETSDAPTFRHGLTYSGHAAACVAAEANLSILEEEGLLERVLDLEPVLAQALAPLADHGAVVDVRAGVGLLAAVQLAPDVDARPVLRAAREQGVLTRLLADNSLHVSPPFVITAEEISRAADVLESALDRARALESA